MLQNCQGLFIIEPSLLPSAGLICFLRLSEEELPEAHIRQELRNTTSLRSTRLQLDSEKRTEKLFEEQLKPLREFLKSRYSSEKVKCIQNL